ncbi:unnamed protein product [Onchocerca flexuosa]|uniref:Cmyb_C domain-containing protein n=1 Tax=Onchocerca flexuosa TaxID=387005 RepID=A0A183H008_9BILA|nr:unnamed protein product [Onchocerca flexuosa]
MSTAPTEKKELLPEKKARSRSLKSSCTNKDCGSAEVPFVSLPIEIPFSNSEKSVKSVQSRPFVSTSNQIPLAKTLAHKKLRKYASETCFSLETSSSSDLLPKEKDLKIASGKNKIFSVRPVETTAGSMVLQDGSVRYSQHIKGEDSEGEASYSGSDATLASMSVTPILWHKSHRSHPSRPKNPTCKGGASISSDIFNTPTSATVPSLASFHQNMKGRQDSIFYNLDDDSLHEFDDEKGNVFHKSFNIF